MKKFKIKIISIFVFFIIILSFTFYVYKMYMDIRGTYDYEKSEYYTNRIIKLLNVNQYIEVNDIFEFEFNKAYVIKETYADGESISKTYNLNINYKEIPMPFQESQKRIIFVNDKGELIYDFRYSQFEMNVNQSDTIIIYPSTKIEKVESEIEGSFGIQFIDS